MKKIDFTNDDRKVIMEYLAAKQAVAAAEVAEKAAKAKAKELFTRLGKEFKTTDKTSYLYGTVQIKGAVHAVVYKETTAKGAIDWKAYALAKGGTKAEAEQYRKRPTVRTSLDWATKDQQKELNQQQFIKPKARQGYNNQKKEGCIMRYQLQVLVGDKMRYYEPSTFAHARWRVDHELVNPDYWIVDLSTGEAIK